MATNCRIVNRTPLEFDRITKPGNDAPWENGAYKILETSVGPWAETTFLELNRDEGIREGKVYTIRTTVKKVQTTGLLLLSRSPFVEGSCGFAPFEYLAFPDSQADKGVAWAASDVTVGDRNLRLLMFLSHTQADYTDENHRWERQRNIRTIQVNLSNQWLDQPGSAVVLFGDLNVLAEDGSGNPTSEYEETTTKLRKLRDVYRTVYPRARQHSGYTYDGPSNTLIPRFAPDEVDWRQRVDYHFFGGPLVDEGRIEARIPSDAFVFEADGRRENLSDHEPLVSEWSPSD